MKSIWQCSSSLWDSISPKINHSIVFLDNPCAEILHWHGGLNRLLQVGAVDVREFSSFECAKESQKKGVFIVSSLLTDITAQIIEDIIRQSHFQYVIVISVISPQVHVFEKTGVAEGDEKKFLEDFEDKLLEWMANMNYTAEVFHVPLFSFNVCPGFFITPAFSAMFPLLSMDVKRVELQYNSSQAGKGDRKIFGDLKEVECGHLPKPLQLNFKMFASCLNGLLEQLGVREDLYSVGHTSRMLAMELENYPPARVRRKNIQNRASLVLIDRTLDLSTPVSCQFETLLDKLTSVLPTLPGHHNDVLIDMSGICSVTRDVGSSVIVPGSLAGSSFLSSPSYLQSLITLKQKETLMEVNRQLVEAAAKEKLPLKLTGKPGRVTAEQLDNTLSLFKGKYEAMQSNLDTLQIAMATSQVLKHPQSKHQDDLVSTEKNLLQVVGDDNSPSGLSQVLKLVETEFKKPAAERIFTLDDVLGILTYLYSLSGNACGDEMEEQQLQNLLTKAIVAQKETLPPVIKSIVGETVKEGIVMTLVEDIWTKLVAIGSARDDLKQFRSLLEMGDAMSPASSMPLLKHITEEIFNPSKPDLVDIEFKSSGIKDLLKSGFGLFRNVSKPRPSDHPLLILFIVGGITATEVKQIRDVVDKLKPSSQVIIGSTKLMRPSDVLQAVFCQNNVNPSAI